MGTTGWRVVSHSAGRGCDCRNQRSGCDCDEAADDPPPLLRVGPSTDDHREEERERHSEEDEEGRCKLRQVEVADGVHDSDCLLHRDEPEQAQDDDNCADPRVRKCVTACCERECDH